MENLVGRDQFEDPVCTIEIDLREIHCETYLAKASVLFQALVNTFMNPYVL
jgi:hypothetical protein